MGVTQNMYLDDTHKGRDAFSEVGFPHSTEKDIKEVLKKSCITGRFIGDSSRIHRRVFSSLAE
jgi:hypothetical protein